MMLGCRGSTAVEGSFCWRLLAPQAEMASAEVIGRPFALTYAVSTVTSVSVGPTGVDAVAVTADATVRIPAATAAVSAALRRLIAVSLSRCPRDPSPRGIEERHPPPRRARRQPPGVPGLTED